MIENWVKQVWRLNNGRPGSNFFQVFGEKPILIKLQPGVFVRSFGCCCCFGSDKKKVPNERKNPFGGTGDQERPEKVSKEQETHF